MSIFEPIPQDAVMGGIEYDDPYDWTTGQVVSALCDPSSSFFRSKSASQIPDLNSLELQLRENEVDGTTLLTVINSQELRDDLGLKKLGQRATVLTAIHTLRAQSAKYQEAAPTMGLPSSSYDQRVTTPYSRLPSVAYGGINPGIESPTVRASNGRMRSESTSVVTQHMPNTLVNPSVPASSIENQKPQAMTPVSLEQVDSSVKNSLSNSTKRRLSTSNQSVSDHGRATLPEANPSEQVNSDDVLSPRKRRRIGVQTGVDPNSLPRNSRFSAPSAKPGSLAIFSVEKIFFNTDQSGDFEDSETFFSAGGSTTDATKAYVNKLMKYRLQRPRHALGPLDGKYYSAIVPYSRKFVRGSQPQYIHVFISDTKGVIMRKDPLSDWPDLEEQVMEEHKAIRRPKNSDFKTIVHWDKVPGVDLCSAEEKYRALFASLEKYAAQDKPDDEAEAFLNFGQSDSEDCYDSEEERDFEESKAVPAKPKALSAEEVSAAINRYIATIVEAWKTKRLPKLDKKAYKLWSKSREDHTKHAQIGQARQRISYLESRTKEIRARIQTGEEYGNVKELEKACGGLDGTVEELEELKWEIAVLNLQTAPTKPTPSSKVNQAEQAPRKPPSLVDGEEILEWESEDDIEDFIVGEEVFPDPIVPSPIVEDVEDAGDAADIDDNMDIDEDVQLPEAVTPHEAHFPGLVTPENVQLPGSVPPEDDSDEEIISPQSRRLLRQRQAALAAGGIDNKDYLSLQLSSPSRINVTHSQASLPMTPIKRKEVQVVDLTISSQESGPDSHQSQTGGFKVPRMGWLFDNETSDSAREGAIRGFNFHHVRKMDWEELEINRDNKRLLIKLCIEMGDEIREDLVDVVRRVDQRELKHFAMLALNAFDNNERTIQSMSHSTNRGSMQVALLWISWVTCDSMHEQNGIPPGYIDAAVAQMEGFPTYASFLREVLRSYISYKNPVVINSTPESGSIKKEGVKGSLRGTMFNDTSNETSNNATPDSSDENMPLPAEQTPHKKRKRKVHEDKDAKATREEHQQRVEDSQKTQSLFMKKLSKEGISNKDPYHQAVSFEEPVIYLDSHIGFHIKAHQLGGVQFMWREIVQDRNREGCLLAHTMGLGKTMQVISLLVTIAIGLKSTDLAIRRQLPSSWKKTKALILCPPTLIDNWLEEFQMWTPQPFHECLISIQAIRSSNKGDAATRITERLKQISDWNKTGGILIMSYTIFASLVKNAKTRNKEAPLDRDQKEKLDTELLGGPDIIIADEAHRMKNTKGEISKAAAQFGSRSRIALTGSPLANHLEEYHAMIDWVAPNYLGDVKEFRARYVEPIKEGLYADSTPTEKRKALTRLVLLNKNIDPKINRADMTSIQSEMPPKTEFLITVPLTYTQTEAYTMFTKVLMGGGTRVGDVTQAKLFSWLKSMQLIVNHPSCFRDKVVGKPRAAKRPAASRRNSTDETSETSDNETEGPGTSTTAISEMSVAQKQQMLFLLGPEEQLKSPYMSNKAAIVRQIIRLSVKAGDKTLIFSQSIPTLDYLEWLCEDLGVPAARLDGTTVMSTRQVSANAFNKSSSVEQVYLISTTAGGLGLNLYGANRVVIYDFGFNPTWEEQAIGRAYRFGQKKPVFVYRLKVGGTFEDAIEMKAVFKTQLASRVVDKKNPVRFASKSAKDYLFPPKEIEQRDLDECRGKDLKVLDKILDMQLGSIKALDLTETFYREDDEPLTAIEESEVQNELRGDLLKRNDPKGYEQWLIQEALEKTRQQQSQSLNGVQKSTQIVSGPNISAPPPSSNSQPPRVVGHVRPTSKPTGSYRNPLEPPVPFASQQFPYVTNWNPASTNFGTNSTFPSLPTLRDLPPRSDEGKGKGKVASNVPDMNREITGGQRSVATPLTPHHGETNQLEGIEKADAAERAKWQEQQVTLADRIVTPLYIPLSTEQDQLHQNAVDRAFAADQHIDHPARDSEEWETMKNNGGFDLWKGPFRKQMRSYDKVKYGQIQSISELWRSSTNPLELHWCAEKGYEEEEAKKEEEQLMRAQQHTSSEEQGSSTGEGRVQSDAGEGGELRTGESVLANEGQGM